MNLVSKIGKWIFGILIAGAMAFGIFCAVMAMISVHGCSGNPKNVIGTVPYVDPNLDVITWDNGLADMLCRRYGRCGLRIIRDQSPVPDNAVEVSRHGNNYDLVWDCDVVGEVHCWTVGWAPDGKPINKCTFGACNSSPMGK
jgi:hypothetical protein